MRQYVLAALLLFLHVSVLAQSNRMSLAELTRQIQADLRTVEGDLAVAFKNLSNPTEQILIHERETFHAASTMKTPVMIEVYKQAAAGKFKLTDSMLVKNEFKSIVDGSPYRMEIADDSGEKLYAMIGKKMTIYDLVYDMITVSSNLATNILIDLVDARRVTQTMRDLGASDIQVLRGVEDTKAFERKLNNTVTAYDLMRIFEQLATGQAGDSAATRAMTDMLLDQQFNEIIPARLPKNVKVAHKTGFITGVQHDSGVVYLPDGRTYVLVLLSKNLKDAKKGVDVLSRVSKKIYMHVSGVH